MENRDSEKDGNRIDGDSNNQPYKDGNRLYPESDTNKKPYEKKSPDIKSESYKKPYDSTKDSGARNEVPKFRPRKSREEISKDIIRRNIRLADFFKLVGLAVKIIGDENAPNMVLDDSFMLNAYVHNFELRFTDTPNQGSTIYTVKLTERVSFDKNRVLSCINDYEKKPVFKVMLNNSNPKLYLSGYNFLNKEEKLGRYPVFAAYSPKVYFKVEKSNEICDELNNEGYSVISV